MIDISKRVLRFFKHYGMPVKFAMKQALPILLPGSPGLVKSLVDLFDCVQEVAGDHTPQFQGTLPTVSSEDLQRMGQVLEVMESQLGMLLGQLANPALEALPEVAQQLVESSLLTDNRVQAAVVQLGELATGLQGLEQQSREILAKKGLAADALEEVWLLQHHSVALEYARYMEELQGLPRAEALVRLQCFRTGLRALGAGDFPTAQATLTDLLVRQPESITTRIALASAEAGQSQWSMAEQHLTEAIQRRPDDQALSYLGQRLSQHTQAQGHPSKSVPAATVPKVGSELDGWRLQRALGRGGWGEVFEARREGKVMALKIMHPKLAQERTLVARFKQEIRTLLRLTTHPNLVAIYDFDKDPHSGCWYLVMERVVGESLETRLRRQGALSPALAWTLFLQIVEGLAQVHAQGIVHRDIKPANLLLRQTNDQPVLVDFGIAGGGGGPHTHLLPSGCTPLFAPPEQLRSGRTDARGDVYSLAASLYYSVAYAYPEDRVPEFFAPERVPESWRGWLARALDPHPKRRPPDAGALLAEMKAEQARLQPAKKVPAKARQISSVLLRAQPKDLSMNDCEAFFKERNFFAIDWNPTGRFTKILEDNGDTITEKNTGLIWQKGGSKRMSYNKGQKYIQQLNRDRFAGRGDWRLPTLEEAASLLEPEIAEKLHIDPMFGERQRWIWTSDTKGSGAVWVAVFHVGLIRWCDAYDCYVRGCCAVG